MTYIVDLDASEIYPKDEKVFNTFIDECLFFEFNLLHFVYIAETIYSINSKSNHILLRNLCCVYMSRRRT